MSLTKNAAKNIFDRLTWHTAKKDQAGIAKELADALMLNTSGSIDINIYEVSQDRLRIELMPG